MSIHLPGGGRLAEEEIRERLERAGRHGLAAQTLVDKLGESWDEQEVRRALARLAAGGEAIEWNRRWMAPRFTDWKVATLKRLANGDAVAEEGGRGGPAHYVKQRELGGARDGDRVLLKPHRGRRPKRRGELPRASVSRVLERRHERVVGTLELGEERRWLIPFDPKLHLEIEVEGGEELLEDTYVVVEIERRPGRSDLPLSGRVVERLGRIGTPGVDVLVLLRHLDIPEAFPPEVLEAAAGLPADPGEDDLSGRRDLRAETAVTIDGGQARDFDDAITVERRDRGGFRVGVHIADVSHYVPEGGVLDLEAYRRATSVYFPDRAVPMLPESLSNGLCSLKPGVPRLTLSAFFDVDPEGRVRRRRFARSVIRSARRLTYAEVRRVLEEPRPGDEKRYGPEVLRLLFDARDVMRLLYRRRVARGSLDFDLPHGDVILDTDGYTVDVKPGQRTVAHRIIEELMLSANGAVARELDRRELPALYRVHEPPSPEKLEDLRETLRTLGISLKGDLAELPPSALQAALARVEGREEEPFVASLVLRAMQRAVYSPEPRGHYALATGDYTHFTSPIRRYPDLLVHRQLKAALDGDPQAGVRALLPQRLPAIAEWCSTAERRAERAERMILQWKLVRLLADRVGETFSGRITGVEPFGLFVLLVDYFVDGLLPVRELDDDWYEHDPEGHRLVGRDRGRVFRLGDAIEVVLTGINEHRRSLDLAPAPPERDRG
ncbi:MAG: ribonuclease R [Thermoanaerobaculia bacterium]|nr:ribonuclease R [Thermoanaerobaculia bacterium]